MIHKLFLAMITLFGLTACSSDSIAQTSGSYDVSPETLWCQRDGGRIYGILYRPSGVSGRLPLVIISHGFGGSHTFGTPYAEALARKGYLCYTFDFCGGSSGSRSDGATTDMSIFTERADLEAIIDQMKQRDDVDAGRITLMGESQGGMVSAITASDRVSDIHDIILFYPALCIPDDAKNRYPTLADVPERSSLWGVQLGRAYYEGLYDFDVYAEIAKFEKPVLLLHGDRDDIVNISYAERAAQTYKDVEYHVMAGAGHGFSGSSQTQAINYAAAFLSKQASNSSTNRNMTITIDGQSLPVTLEDNDATQALVTALQQGDITYEAHDYGGFEKVGALGRTLPSNDAQITTQAGDVILYSSNQIVLFYGSNSWAYTRLGRIQYSTQSELESFLKAGQGNVSVTLSLAGTSGINSVRSMSSDIGAYHSLGGHRVVNPAHGIYIKNGKKVLL